MWRSGTLERGSPDAPESKVLTAGWDRLAKISGLHWTNARKNIFRLTQKLSIEVVGAEDSAARTGRQYRIWSERAIVERRHAAGLIWVERTKGVRFVSPPVMPTVSDLPSARHSSILSGTRTVSESHRVPPILRALRQHAGVVDDDASTRLAAACRRRVPDATDEEIVHFIDATGGDAGLTRALGYFLAAVPKCFEGEDFRRFREERRRGREAEAAREKDLAREALADPEADEQIKAWARQVLFRTAVPGD